MPVRPLVCLVDDDESVRESLPDWLRAFGFEACPFSSAKAFLDSDRLELCDCLILDVAMPGMSGPALQLELARRNCNIPIVFITAVADGAIKRKVLTRGAVACLAKPFSERALLDAVTSALESY